ncbi:hypothetical protein ACLOJK_000173 [Asimina triloba]
MDHYKALGVTRNATKVEIKEAFRTLALKFHPDKHSQSTKEVRDSAVLKFKQVSEAYEVLIDDQKRADYNLRSTTGFHSRGAAAGAGAGAGHGYHYSRNAYRARERTGFDLDVLFRFVTRRSFLLNLAFAGQILAIPIKV